MMGAEYEVLTVTAYAEEAALTDQGSDGRSLSFPLLGLYGETGSLLSVVKKKQRDSASYLGYAEAVVEELGDVLWYLSTVARRGGICLSAIAAACLDSGYRVWGRPSPTVTFEALQPDLIKRDGAPTPAFEATLLQLAGEVGAILTDHHAGRLKGDQAALGDHLVAVLRRLIKAANEAGVTLEAAAIKNLTKIFDRWPKDRAYPAPFDEGSDPDERLPRHLVIDIFEKEVRGQAFVFQRCGGIFVGDRLTDNALEPDDYRFHDVFHLAHVAVLGWSPVIRALLRLKRKSEPAVDEAQDGARAILIEEGVTTWIFGQAQRLKFFEGLKPGDLPLDTLKHVREFVAGYEAADCPLWLWEDAILQGYVAFRFLQKHRRGRLTVDLANRRLRIEELSV
jgi:NTP pyrophosphatase (non-canonical NTP hydrolase)